MTITPEQQAIIEDIRKVHKEAHKAGVTFLGACIAGECTQALQLVGGRGKDIVVLFGQIAENLLEDAPEMGRAENADIAKRTMFAILQSMLHQAAHHQGICGCDTAPADEVEDGVGQVAGHA